MNELAREYELHPTLIHSCKKNLLDGAEGVFGQPSQRGADDCQATMAALYKQIGRLKVEVEWLKKVGGFGLSVAQRRSLVDADHVSLSVRRQCALLGLNRFSFQFEAATTSATNLTLMNWIDRHDTNCH